jgi:hypothetical protein
MYLFARQASQAQPRPDSRTVSREDPVIVCRNCQGHITEPACQIQKDGAFCHTFANPSGQVFEIGCFSAAPGCAVVPPSFSEFSWFEGYDWCIGICRDCTAHLGWIYDSGQDQFWGLILDKLHFPPA